MLAACSATSGAPKITNRMTTNASTLNRASTDADAGKPRRWSQATAGWSAVLMMTPATRMSTT